MAITMDLHMPAEAGQLYDPINREIGVSAGNLPAGMIHHYATKTRDSFNIFEVWESQEAFDQFARDRLLPALKKLAGEQALQIQPIFGQLHNEFQR